MPAEGPDGGAEPNDVGGEVCILLGAAGGVRGTLRVNFESVVGEGGVVALIVVATGPGGGGTFDCVVLSEPGRMTGSGSLMLGFLMSAKLLCRQCQYLHNNQLSEQI